MTTDINTDKVCCPGMRGALSMKSCRGLSIELELGDDGKKKYFIYSRGVDKDDVKLLQDAKIEIDVKFNLESQTGMMFCPWCGMKLV